MTNNPSDPETRKERLMQVIGTREFPDQLTKDDVILRGHVLCNATILEILAIEETSETQETQTDEDIDEDIDGDIEQATRDLFERAMKPSRKR